MNQDVPQPITATRSPGLGQRGCDGRQRARSRGARRAAATRSRALTWCVAVIPSGGELVQGSAGRRCRRRPTWRARRRAGPAQALGRVEVAQERVEVGGVEGVAGAGRVHGYDGAAGARSTAPSGSTRDGAVGAVLHDDGRPRAASARPRRGSSIGRRSGRRPARAPRPGSAAAGRGAAAPSRHRPTCSAGSSLVSSEVVSPAACARRAGRGARRPARQQEERGDVHVTGAVADRLLEGAATCSASSVGIAPGKVRIARSSPVREDHGDAGRRVRGADEAGRCRPRPPRASLRHQVAEGVRADRGDERAPGRPSRARPWAMIARSRRRPGRRRRAAARPGRTAGRRRPQDQVGVGVTDARGRRSRGVTVVQRHRAQKMSTLTHDR